MDKMLKVVVLAFGLLLLFGASCRGEGEPSEQKQMRIVSLAPNATEILFALGLGDFVVGVTRFCNYPPRAAELPKIGGYIDPEIERILALKPTMVVGIGDVEPHRTVCETVEKLSSASIRSVLIQEKDIASLYDSIEKIASFCGVSERAKRLIGGIKERLDAIRARRKGSEPRILFLCGVDPLVAVGRRSFINELIEICGAENCISEPRDYIQVDVERVVSCKPDVIVQMAMGTEKSFLDFWQKYAELIPAVKSNHVVCVDADLFT
ncbi:MAG: cobalamin-binding protein, partial [Planctomycetota bacterium]|nr:cobalamin-binding protein [Planctomycetota bacterium]